MRWQIKRCSSKRTLQSTDSSGILQCFRGTTVCAASGGLDMQVPDPFLQPHNILVRPSQSPVGPIKKSSEAGDLNSPSAGPHTCHRGTGGVVAIADWSWFAAEWRTAVCSTVGSSSSAGHSSHTLAALQPAASGVLLCRCYPQLLKAGVFVKSLPEDTSQTESVSVWIISIWSDTLIHFNF